MNALATLAALTLAALAPGAPHDPDEPVAAQAAAGASSGGRWLVHATAGYPWWGARAQLGLAHGLSPLFEVNTALGRRWRPAAGLAMLWLDRPHLRIGGEALLGWLFQAAPLRRFGPNVELRVRIAVPLRRAVPYAVFGSQHTLLSARDRVERLDGSTSTQIRLGGEWTGFATVGVLIAASSRLAIDFGVDLTGYDSLRAPSIPGAHFGLAFGGRWRPQP